MSGGPRFHVPVGIVALAVPPDVPVIGETYFDTALGQLRSWDGTVWVGTSSDTELDIDFVNVVGDAMTGELTLPDQVVVPPSVPGAVAVKGYVDQLVTVSDVPPSVPPVRDGLIWTVTGPDWTPVSIPGLFAWLDASTLDLNDGDPVTVWPDLSGNGYDATEYGGLHPTYNAWALNGKPGVRFGDPTYRRLIVDHGKPLGDRTMFIVHQAAGNHPGSYHTLILQETESYWQVYATIGAPWRVFIGPHELLGTTMPVTDVTNVMTVWSGPADCGLRIDGATEAAGGASRTGQPNSTPIHIGGWAAGSYGFNGWISEFVMYDRLLDLGEMEQVEAYLQDKFGTTAREVGGERE